MDTNLNQTYSGTVGVKNNTEYEKNLYCNLFSGRNKLSYLLHEWFPQFNANLQSQLPPVWIDRLHQKRLDYLYDEVVFKNKAERFLYLYWK